jgi:uncharacterized protein YodC (DUF2158 family)
MSEQFKPGDVVELKSGGPKMTVEEVDEEAGGVFCTWFDEGNQPQQRNFIAATLKKAEKPKASMKAL